MTTVATISGLGEDRARALGAAVDGDAILWERALDVAETAPGIWQVAVYFEHGPDGVERAALARLAVDLGGAAAFAIAALPEVNWVAKSLEGLAPVRAGPFLVHGSHDRDKARANDIAIEIEAGLAFGTGHHGTTAGCLMAIDRIAKARRAPPCARPRHRIGRARHRPRQTHAGAGRGERHRSGSGRGGAANVRLNGVAGCVRTVVADGLHHATIAGGAPYDLVVANILAGPLVALAPAIRNALAPGGTVILSGLTLDQQRRVAAAYRGVGLRRVFAIAIGEWATLSCGDKRHTTLTPFA